MDESQQLKNEYIFITLITLIVKKQRKTFDQLIKTEDKSKEILGRRKKKEKVEKKIDFDLNERIDNDQFFWKRKKTKRYSEKLGRRERNAIKRSLFLPIDEHYKSRRLADVFSRPLSCKFHSKKLPNVLEEEDQDNFYQPEVAQILNESDEV